MYRLIGTNSEHVALTSRADHIFQQLLEENNNLRLILESSVSFDDFKHKLKNMAETALGKTAEQYSREEIHGKETLRSIPWNQRAAMRIMEYIEHEGDLFKDLNMRGKPVENAPLKTLYLAFKNGRGGGEADFFIDFIHLFRQLHKKQMRIVPEKNTVKKWMNRHPSGLEKTVVEQRKKNRDYILKIIIRRIDRGDVKSERYSFSSDMNFQQKLEKARKWWKCFHFHLRFAVRSPELLDEMTGNALSYKTMNILREAQKSGIPIFVNPYYLSLINVSRGTYSCGTDIAIRQYIFHSEDLVKEFGHIVAWEKEDTVEPGKPNAAGWILPTKYNIHRRYPEVAILVPDTKGRACGGLCTVCQRMYDFQNGHLNFNLDKLKPDETWSARLRALMDYFEKDSQLRDILITGGDALMSSDDSISEILNAILEMAQRKRIKNRRRRDGEKYAEIQRIRLGTRTLAYIPQRITEKLCRILKDFREKALETGIRQFIIQTHIESPMEVTPEMKKAVDGIQKAGWTVTNQHVYITAASQRGHTAKLRKVLNDIGVLSYYTFTVKGFFENREAFTPNARSMQERVEEKFLGLVPGEKISEIKSLSKQPHRMIEKIDKIRNEAGVPFLSTDKNVLNIPGVGKSLTFKVIGITREGRRILEFSHDRTRNHSPIIEKMGKIIIIESKSIARYLRQLEEYGEDTSEYEGIYGYSFGETEPVMPIYEYPPFDFKCTKEYTNLEISD